MEYKQDNFFDKDIFLRLQSRRDDFNKGNYFTAILMTPVSLLYEAIRFPTKKSMILYTHHLKKRRNRYIKI